MKILGINDGHLATAALLVDGKIVACVSEEKFTKIKNQIGFPHRSVAYCLKSAGLKFTDIDFIAFAGTVSPPLPPSSEISKADALFEQIHLFLRKILLHWFEPLSYHLPFLRLVKETLYRVLYHSLETGTKTARLKVLGKYYHYEPKRVLFIDHHLSHAAAAVYGSTFPSSGEDALVLTCDGEGDQLSATVGVYKKGHYQRISQTSMNNSLGNFYYAATVYLGMKAMEHEYKVMGLAPFANEKDYDRIYQVLKPLIWVDKESLQIKTKFDSHQFIYFFSKTFSNYRYGKNFRFDFVAAAVQKVTEGVLTSLVTAAIAKTKINNVAISGGVFMNVKANQKIMELAAVKKVFFMSSASDESNALGVAWWVYHQKTNLTPAPLTTMSLGPVFSNNEIGEVLLKNHGVVYQKKKNITREVASLLAKGHVVAIFNGHCEFGARALGNRSILARADDLKVVDLINKMIKSRDFWMPFAPVILEERKADYLIDPDKTNPEFMMVTFTSTAKAEVELAGGMHRWDKTMRAQVIQRTTNHYYYEVVKQYEELTGIGGLINTSFNLHGEPIAATPEDALRVFLKSGLEYLALEDYLVIKK